MAVIFTDTFDSATTQALETYDAGWIISTFISGGSSGRARVTTSGTVEPNQSGGLNAYYRSSAGTPTVNMETQGGISISGNVSGHVRFGAIMNRCSTAANEYYAAQLIFDPTSSWSLRIARETNVLASLTGLGLSLDTFYNVRLRSTVGATSSQVVLTAQIVGQTTELQFTDGTASFRSSGYPGLINWQSAADISRQSSFQADDLTSAATALGFLTIVRE